VLGGLHERLAQRRGALAGDVAPGAPCRRSCARSASDRPTSTAAGRSRCG
jgi:hypothetical protein